jgi:Ni/Co efflux regulator RcnB
MEDIMKRALAAFAALTISLPVLAHAEDHRDERDGRGGQQRTEAPAPQAQAPAPQQNRGGPRAGGFFGRVDPNAARAAPNAATPNTAQERGRGAPNTAQERGRGAPNTALEPGRGGPITAQIAPNREPNAGRDRGRGGRNEAQVAPRQGGPAVNFAQDRDRRDFRGDGRDDRRGGRDFGGDRRDGRDFRGGRDRGRVFNFRGREYAAMRGPAFSYPRGWGYRHWDRGDVLPRVFLSGAYFFDYDWLGLPPPPPGARWVRNGPDALLVSVYNDRIIDVIYNAFY